MDAVSNTYNRVGNFYNFKDRLAEIAENSESARGKFFRTGLSYLGRAMGDFLKATLSGTWALVTKNERLSKSASLYLKTAAADCFHITTCALGVLAPETVAKSQQGTDSMRGRINAWVTKKYLKNLARQATRPVAEALCERYSVSLKDEGVQDFVRRIEKNIANDLFQHLSGLFADKEVEFPTQEDRSTCMDPKELTFRSFRPYMSLEERVRVQLADDGELESHGLTVNELLQSAVDQEVTRAQVRANREADCRDVFEEWKQRAFADEYQRQLRILQAKKPASEWAYQVAPDLAGLVDAQRRA